jgi:hypothetical protein
MKVALSSTINHNLVYYISASVSGSVAEAGCQSQCCAVRADSTGRCAHTAVYKHIRHSTVPKFAHHVLYVKGSLFIRTLSVGP